MDRLARQQPLAESIVNFKDDFLRVNQTITGGIVQANIETLREMWGSFQTRHRSLCRRGDLQATEYFSRDVHGITQRNYSTQLGYFYDELARRAPPPPESRGHSRFHLPKIDLPKFSGHHENWESFRDLFLSLVGSEASLTGVQKLHFLKTSVEGAAKAALEKLPITESNYAIAWDILVKRYENTRLLTLRHLNELSTLSVIVKEDPKSLQSLLDTVSSRRDALKSLGRPVQHWDDFILYLTRALDPVTRNDWEKSTTKTDDMPTFNEILTFLQNRIRALRSSELIQTTVQAPASRSLLLAAKSRTKIQSLETSDGKVNALPQCPVCEGRHSIMRCPDFLKLEVGQRRATSSRLMLCYNCLKSGYAAVHCSSNFVCKECRATHHTLLHESRKRSTRH